jgi:hypothetical protein
LEGCDSGGTITADGSAVDVLKTAARLTGEDNRGINVFFRGGRALVVYRDRIRGIKFGGGFSASTSPPPGCVRSSRRFTVDARYLLHWLENCQPAAAESGGFIFRQPRAEGPIALSTAGGAFEYVLMPLSRPNRRQAG